MLCHTTTSVTATSKFRLLFLVLMGLLATTSSASLDLHGPPQQASHQPPKHAHFVTLEAFVTAEDGSIHDSLYFSTHDDHLHDQQQQPPPYQSKDEHVGAIEINSVAVLDIEIEQTMMFPALRSCATFGHHNNNSWYVHVEDLDDVSFGTVLEPVAWNAWTRADTALSWSRMGSVILVAAKDPTIGPRTLLISLLQAEHDTFHVLTRRLAEFPRVTHKTGTHAYHSHHQQQQDKGYSINHQPGMYVPVTMIIQTNATSIGWMSATEADEFPAMHLAEVGLAIIACGVIARLKSMLRSRADPHKKVQSKSSAGWSSWDVRTAGPEYDLPRDPLILDRSGAAQFNTANDSGLHSHAGPNSDIQDHEDKSGPKPVLDDPVITGNLGDGHGHNQPSPEGIADTHQHSFHQHGSVPTMRVTRVLTLSDIRKEAARRLQHSTVEPISAAAIPQDDASGSEVPTVALADQQTLNDQPAEKAPKSLEYFVAQALAKMPSPMSSDGGVGTTVARPMLSKSSPSPQQDLQYPMLKGSELHGSSDGDVDGEDQPHPISHKSPMDGRECDQIASPNAIDKSDRELVGEPLAETTLPNQADSTTRDELASAHQSRPNETEKVLFGKIYPFSPFANQDGAHSDTSADSCVSTVAPNTDFSSTRGEYCGGSEDSSCCIVHIVRRKWQKDGEDNAFIPASAMSSSDNNQQDRDLVESRKRPRDDIDFPNNASSSADQDGESGVKIEIDTNLEAFPDWAPSQLHKLGSGCVDTGNRAFNATPSIEATAGRKNPKRRRYRKKRSRSKPSTAVSASETAV